MVLVDEDREDCRSLKRRLNVAAEAAGLASKSAPENGKFQVLNRIAVEELEAWFLGDPAALVAAYAGVSPNFASKAAYRDPDAVRGGTWEAIERLLQRAGYFPGGLAKIELARAMAKRLDPSRNSSRSFKCFVDGISAL